MYHDCSEQIVTVDKAAESKNYGRLLDFRDARVTTQHGGIYSEFPILDNFDSYDISLIPSPSYICNFISQCIACVSNLGYINLEVLYPVYYFNRNICPNCIVRTRQSWKTDIYI
jgi:hypothetical protein